LARNEDGEFELILGNRQLLSVFFIVVILLGVFFTMGYIVGRNSAPSTEVASTSRSETSPLPAEVATRTPETSTRSAETSAPTETPRKAEAETKDDDRDQTASRGAASSKSESSSRAESTSAEAQEKSRTEKQDKKDRSVKKTSAGPQSGQAYLQLAATSRHEADIMVDVLRKKGFKSLSAEIEEKPGTFRVLVGPIAEGGTNKLRSDLQGSGFPGNAAIRRTF
jgi:hypothetical protein